MSWSGSFTSKILQGVIYSSASISGIVFYIMPNIYLLDEFQKVTQLYRKANPVRVSDKIETLAKQCMDDMKLKESEKENIRLYTASGFTFFRAGSIWKTNLIEGFKGVVLGIPVNFNWDEVQKREKSDIIIKGNPIDWSSDVGKQLEATLLISDKAKKYAIAEKLFHISSIDVLLKGSLISLSVTLTIFYMNQIRLMRPFQKGRFKPLKYIFSMVAISFNYLFYILCNDLYTCRVEEHADEFISNLSKEYIEGGVEYYENALKRNVALRNILGKEGKSAFSFFGNDEAIFRQKHIPLTVRRDFFKSKLNL